MLNSPESAGLPLMTASSMMATAESPNNVGRHLDLLTTLPDVILIHILRLVFDHTNRCTINALRINHRVFSLAKPIFLSTMILHSEVSVLRLMHRCIAPSQATLTAADREHVKCIEIDFLPSSQRRILLAPSVLRAATAFPNLRTLRFRFSVGVPLSSNMPTLELHQQLAADMVAHAHWLRVDSPLFSLLSSLNPQRFEWISEGSSGRSKLAPCRKETEASVAQPIRVLAFRGAFRALIKRWDSLTHVYLDGICLLAKYCTSTFHLALLAKHMHINVDSYGNTLYLFSTSPHVLSGSRKCESLVVERPGAKEDRATICNAVLRPGTLLSFRGFSSAQCASFKQTFLTTDDQPSFGPVPPEQVFRSARAGVRELRKLSISRKKLATKDRVIRTLATVPSRDKATTGPSMSGDRKAHPTLTSSVATVDFITIISCLFGALIVTSLTVLSVMSFPALYYFERRRGAAPATTTSETTSTPTARQDKSRSRVCRLRQHTNLCRNKYPTP
ncbi:uncharacterized protein EDB91DRAFT_1131837 [Suillus paluster]|uniref:uncharacterized protein n=1 Tax=Suillus paluster TaxID=48578 RepID=UPI001B877CBC|nr:uncharacterized protein EDB91DRAFT_1131837 [Suillus paluster]KAG1740859.1 hypothetical protein EDB91DRAFT_1131837 [Suillus paluster]